MAFKDEAGDVSGEQPADDLKSMLAAAVAEHEPEAAPEKPANAAVKPEASDAPSRDEAAPVARTRGADGKFVKGAESAEPVVEETGDDPAKPEADEKPATEVADDAAAAEKAEADKKAEAEITGRWSVADKELLKKLPPEGRDLILRRHRDMEAAFTKKNQEFTTFRREYEPIDKMFEPWRDRMQAAGYTKQSLITAWANAEKRLMDPNDRVNVVAGLIKGYQVDLGKVAAALGMRPRPVQQQQDGEQPAPVQNGDGQYHQLPPELTQQLAALQQRLDAQDRERADSTRRAQMGAEQRVMSEIETFKSAQDDKGQLLHPHFDDLEDDMTQLAGAAIAARKPVPSLQDLYEKAVWANPSTRKAQLAADQKAQQARTADEARAKAAAARRAGSSVTGAPGSGQAPAAKSKAEQTLREQLETNYAEVAQA